MRLQDEGPLEAFAAAHPDARKPLAVWRRQILQGEFAHFVELKRTFGTADYVRPFVVFDVGGNKYRLIAGVDYELRVVKIFAVLPHAEYDRNDWRR